MKFPPLSEKKKQELEQLNLLNQIRSGFKKIDRTKRTGNQNWTGK